LLFVIESELDRFAVGKQLPSRAHFSESNESFKRQTVIASEAKQSSFARRKLDCFVAALLAMTVGAS
jgi:hypothetical protein